MMIYMREKIEQAALLRRINDVTLWPKISKRKAKNAIKKYGNSHIKSEDVMLIIDNTILRSSKQGMFLTNDSLFAFSEYSGKYSIKIEQILFVEPKIKSVLRTPLVGIEINKEYFMSLPGLNEMIEYDEESIPAILVLCLFLNEISPCQIVIPE